MKACIIKLGALGDVVRTTSLVPPLVEMGYKIVWITEKKALPLIKYHPNIIALPIDNTIQIEEILCWKFDWVISLDDDRNAYDLASRLNTHKLSGANSRNIYTDDLSEWFDMGVLSKYGLDYANKLKKENKRTVYEILYDGLTLPRPIHRPQVYSNYSINYILPENKLIVGLNTAAGTRWKYKSWSLERTIELTKKLIDDDIHVLLFGGSQEKERNEQIVKKVPSVQLIPTYNNSLYFSQVIKQCNVLVTSDSLALHLAIAHNVPTVSFFGPTSAAEIDIFDNGIKLETTLPCGRCYLKDCDIRPTCMDALTIENVYNNVKRLLSTCISR